MKPCGSTSSIGVCGNIIWVSTSLSVHLQNWQLQHTWALSFAAAIWCTGKCLVFLSSLSCLRSLLQQRLHHHDVRHGSLRLLFNEFNFATYCLASAFFFLSPWNHGMNHSDVKALAFYVTAKVTSHEWCQFLLPACHVPLSSQAMVI